MFDGDLTALSTADLLESAAEHRAEENRRAARLIEHAQVFADRHHPDTCPARPGRRGFDGRERGVVLGGDGCPEIAEFAPAEFGLMIGVSPGVAADYIGQALALRHRFPFTWAKVRCGEATPWKARLLTTACLKLSAEAAGYVDKRVAPILDSVTPYRLDKIIRAAKMHADPDLARAEAEEKRRERGVFVGRTTEHGTKTIYIRTGAGAASRFDARIAGIADALRVLGDSRNVDIRRADAVDIIADPAFTEELLLQTRNHHLHGTEPVHHIADPASEPDDPAGDSTVAADSHAAAGAGAAHPSPGAGPARRAMQPAAGSGSGDDED